MSLKKLPVDLDELATAMDQFDRDINEWYFDAQTGEVILVGRESLDIAEEGDDEEEEADLKDWQEDELERARQIVDDATERFHRVPECERTRTYGIMEDFIADVPDPRVKERLERAIGGKGAFRRFKDQLLDYPEVRERWFAFETEAKRQWAIEWLEELGIESTWEPPKPRRQTPADRKPSIVGIHHVQIAMPQGAEAAARKFYCDVLGLAEISKPEALQGRGGLWVQAADLPIHIGTELNHRPSAKAHVAYQVADLNKWRDRLIKNGVEVLDSVPIPGLDRFEFRDPFGNRIEFIQPQ